MKIQFKKRAIVVAASAMAAGLVFGGVAVAAWLSNGTGTGSAKATTAIDLTTSTATASADLYPGGTGALNITINNPNPYPVTITDIASSGAATASLSTCVVTGVSLSALTGLTDVVDANASKTFSHADAVSMSNLSDDGCQGATFTIPVSLSGHSGS